CPPSPSTAWPGCRSCSLSEQRAHSMRHRNHVSCPLSFFSAIAATPRQVQHCVLSATVAGVMAGGEHLLQCRDPLEGLGHPILQQCTHTQKSCLPADRLRRLPLEGHLAHRPGHLEHLEDAESAAEASVIAVIAALAAHERGGLEPVRGDAGGA